MANNPIGRPGFPSNTHNRATGTEYGIVSSPIKPVILPPVYGPGGSIFLQDDLNNVVTDDLGNAIEVIL